MLRRLSRWLRPIVPTQLRADIPVVPVVRLAGIIGFSTPLRPGITLAGIARALDRAFGVRDAKAVALLINSPGGSPVQSHLIYRRIRQLSEDKKRPVLAFVEDVAASGGYMLACAADEIICDPSSITGSIGVVGGSFGFDQLMKKLGVERRIYTSGDRKVMLDPFMPENPDDVARLKAIQKQIHDVFIALVKERRGAKLNGPESALFSGEYWAGGRALELGLIDSLGDIRSVLKTRYGDKVETPLIAAERSFFARRLTGSAGVVRPSLADEIVSTLEERAIWARFGL